VKHHVSFVVVRIDATDSGLDDASGVAGRMAATLLVEQRRLAN
jgi:hypothetical protein